MNAIQITTTPQDIIYDKVDDDLRVIVFKNKAGAYVVRTTGIVGNETGSINMTQPKKRGGYYPNAGRYPKGSKNMPDTILIRIQKPTLEEAELLKLLSPVDRLKILLVAAKSK